MGKRQNYFRVRSHAPSIQSHRGTKVVWPDFQPMRVPEEPVCIDLIRQNPVFTSLHLKSPVHVHRLRALLIIFFPCKGRRLVTVVIHILTTPIDSKVGLNWSSAVRGCTSRTGYFKCREVKTGFYRNKSMQTGSSGTPIGWKSGQTTFVPLWDRMEGAWLRTQNWEIYRRSKLFIWPSRT